jgi:hypothetical protein
MAANFPNIIPENNLRLPDALTVRYGPAPLLARFVLEGDRFVRQAGIHLRLRHDFDELVYVNRHATATGSWFPLVDMFNPAYADLSPENSYWLSGEDENGNIVLTGAFRVNYWPRTTLAEEARLLFCGRRAEAQPFEITAPAARIITGLVVWGGSLWIHPDYRGHNLSRLVGRIGRAFAVARWPVDWMIALVMPPLADNGTALNYGYKHLSRSIFFPGSPLGDAEFVLAYLSAPEAYDDFAAFLTDELLAPAEMGSRREKVVIRTSPESPFQGSSSRS